MYLMKIQIIFCVKKIRSVFNENIDQLYVLKKIRSVFNENTYQFYVLKIRSEKFKSVILRTVLRVFKKSLAPDFEIQKKKSQQTII